MSDTIITLDFLITEFEKRCQQKHGSFEIAQQLMTERYADKSLDGWEYFECLKAAFVSDGSLENAHVRLTECLRRYARSIPHGKRQQVVGRLDGQSC